jgi:hypothetical protein
MKFRKINKFDVYCAADDIKKRSSKTRIQHITKRINNFLVIKRLHKIKAKISYATNKNSKN